MTERATTAMTDFRLGIQEEPILEARVEEARARLKRFMEEYPHWTLKDISRSMQQFFGKQQENGRRMNTGLSPATLRNFLDGGGGVSLEAQANTARRILIWLDDREHRVSGEVKVREYESYKKIKYGIAQAAAARQFVIIIGPSGIGKTFAAREFGNRYTSGGDYIIVEPYDGIRPKSFLRLLARALGLETRGSVEDLLIRIRGFLRETPRVIVVDEGDFLPPESLNHLVYLWNGIHIGIVIMGTQRLDETLRRSSLERVRTRRRLTINLNTARPSLGDIETLLNEAFEKSLVTTEAVKALATFASNYRELEMLIGLAKDVLKLNPERSLREIILEVGPRLM